MAAPFHRVDGTVGADVAVAADVDVARPPQRRQAEAEARDVQPGRAQGARLNPGRLMIGDVRSPILWRLVMFDRREVSLI